MGNTIDNRNFISMVCQSSDLEPRLASAAAKQLDITLTAPERPGFSDSAFIKGLSLKNWPKQISQLADSPGLTQFDVIGFSGGGPFALTCAYFIPQRIKRVTLVSSNAPFDSPATQAHVDASFNPLYE